MRRSLCRLQLHAVFCEVSVLHAPVQGCSSRTRGKAAGNRGSFVEAGGGKDLAEQGLVAINIGGAGEGKTKETGTERSGGRECEQGGPTGCEGSNGCRPQRSRHSTGPAASEEANELGGLGTPADTNLKCKDNKSAPLRAHQLWIGAFLSPACEAKSGALVLALVPARSATSIERGNQGGIDSKLRVLSADAQRAWRSQAPFDEWWPAAVAALLARPFIPVRELGAAVEHVSQAFPPQALVSNTLLRFWS